MTGMSIKPNKSGLEVMNQLMYGLYASASLMDFCKDVLGADATLYIGFDPSNPPKDNKVPWIGCTMDSLGVSDGYTHFEYSISVGAALSASTSTETDNTTGIISYDSVDIADEFCRLLIEATNNAMMRTDEQNNLELLTISQAQISTNLPHVRVYFDMTIGVDLETNID